MHNNNRCRRCRTPKTPCRVRAWRRPDTNDKNIFPSGNRPFGSTTRHFSECSYIHEYYRPPCWFRPVKHEPENSTGPSINEMFKRKKNLVVIFRFWNHLNVKKNKILFQRYVYISRACRRLFLWENDATQFDWRSPFFCFFFEFHRTSDRCLAVEWRELFWTVSTNRYLYE